MDGRKGIGTLTSVELMQAGPASNRCSCIGPRAMAFG